MKKIINTRIRGPESEVLDGCRELLKGYGASCVVADAQERAAVMHSYLRSLTTSTRFVGPALTVRLEYGNQVDCLDALAVAQRGDAVVVDAVGETETSIWGGGLTSGLCLMEGVAGAVVDGAIRDTDETRDLGCQIVSKGVLSGRSPTGSRTRASRRPASTSTSRTSRGTASACATTSSFRCSCPARRSCWSPACT